MAIEKVKELINMIRTDPKAKELLGDVSEPRSEEEMIRLCAEIAPKLGFDVTEADIREAISALSRERVEKTAADVKKLSDEDVEQAAGGAVWQGEDAPDGHEYGCFLTYHTYGYQEKNKLWCEKQYYCDNMYFHPSVCSETFG